MIQLEQFMEEGLIWIEDGEYIGRVSDSKTTALAKVGEEYNLNEFLIENDQPSQWR